MKYLSLLALAVLALPSLQAAQAQDACIQVIQPAVSPDGVCQEYATPCDVPEDWKSVPSCDLIDTPTEASKPSLEAKMSQRALRMQRYWQLKRSQQGSKDLRQNSKDGRLGSGSLTRSDRAHRLPTSTNSTIGNTRTFTEKDYTSDIAKRYSQRGGYQRANDTTKEERQARRAVRAPIYSRSDANREGNLNTTVKWNVLSRQFTTPKNYGPNPYRIRSKHLAQQKAERDARNQEVDVYQRRLSRSRIYRGGRLEGNLSGDASFLKQEAEKRSATIEELNQE